MSVHEYLESIKARLLTDPLVTHFKIVRERETDTDGHLRARMSLTDGSLLEFSEYFQWLAENEIKVVTYGYHWVEESGQLISRWDNTPHHPELPGFPYHHHDGESQTVAESQPMSIFTVLDEIGRKMKA